MSEHVHTPDPGPGPTPAAAPPAGQPTPAVPLSTTDRVNSIFDAIRRAGLVRTNDRWIGGVAGGIGLRLGIDPLLVRAAFIVLSFFGGTGFVLYALGWALLPEQSDGRIHLQEAIRGRFDSALVGAGAFFIIGNTWTFGRFGWFDWFGPFNFIFGMAFIAFVVLLIVTLRKGRGLGRPPQGPGAFGAQPPYDPAPDPNRTAPTETASAPSFVKQQAPTPPYPSTPQQIYPAPQGYAAPQTYPGPQAPTYAMRWQPAPVPLQTPRQKNRLGAGAFGLVTGLSLLTFAILLIGERADWFTGNVLVTSFGASIIIAGLFIIAAGMRGRSSGGVGFIALVAVIFGAPLAAFTLPNTSWINGTSAIVQDGDFRPDSWAQAAKGYSAGIGSSTIDLSDLTPPTGETVTVPVQAAVGDLTIVLPADIAATATARIGVGDVTWNIDGVNDTWSGIAQDTRNFSTDEVEAGADPQVHLDVSVGAGKIIFKEEK